MQFVITKHFLTFLSSPWFFEYFHFLPARSRLWTQNKTPELCEGPSKGHSDVRLKARPASHPTLSAYQPQTVAQSPGLLHTLVLNTDLPLKSLGCQQKSEYTRKEREPLFFLSFFFNFCFLKNTSPLREPSTLAMPTWRMFSWPRQSPTAVCSPGPGEVPAHCAPHTTHGSVCTITARGRAFCWHIESTQIGSLVALAVIRSPPLSYSWIMYCMSLVGV